MPRHFTKQSVEKWETVGIKITCWLVFFKNIRQTCHFSAELILKISIRGVSILGTIFLGFDQEKKCGFINGPFSFFIRKEIFWAYVCTTFRGEKCGKKARNDDRVRVVIIALQRISFQSAPAKNANPTSCVLIFLLYTKSTFSSKSPPKPQLLRVPIKNPHHFHILLAVVKRKFPQTTKIL